MSVMHVPVLYYLKIICDTRDTSAHIRPAWLQRPITPQLQVRIPLCHFITDIGWRMMKAALNPYKRVFWVVFFVCLFLFFFGVTVATQEVSGWLPRSFSRLDNGGVTCSVTIMMQQHHSTGAWRLKERKKQQKNMMAATHPNRKL